MIANYRMNGARLLTLKEIYKYAHANKQKTFDLFHRNACLVCMMLNCSVRSIYIEYDEDCNADTIPYKGLNVLATFMYFSKDGETDEISVVAPIQFAALLQEISNEGVSSQRRKMTGEDFCKEINKRTKKSEAYYLS